MSKKATQSIKIDATLHQALCAVSEVKKSTPTAIVNDLVKDYVLNNLSALTNHYESSKKD